VKQKEMQQKQYWNKMVLFCVTFVVHVRTNSTKPRTGARG